MSKEEGLVEIFSPGLMSKSCLLDFQEPDGNTHVDTVTEIPDGNQN